ncbi:MAG TPA: polysaccharide lyase family 7 protein, partial [Candidatus Aquilonibacter sp.]|nr:polysaccharide lyase family 7 protein [Candidatus Aquilonibacter sp.]
MFKSFKFAGIALLVMLALHASAQIGGTGWKTQTVSFNVQKPYNTNEDLRYWFTNNIYHCMVYSNDQPFSEGNTTLPRTEMRFNPDFTNGDIQYQAVMMVPANENSYCIMQDHTGDAQSPTYGPVAIMFIWQSRDGGSIWNGYTGHELVKNMGNQWFQLNVDHNVVTHTIRAWINGQLVVTESDNGATDYYFKTGVYEQNISTPTYEMDTYVTNGPNSIKEWVSSGTNPPAAPTGFTATPTVANIALAWNSSVGATNYNLERSTTNGGSYTTIATLTGTNYTDSSVTSGTTYYYVVTAADQFGVSTNSTQVSAELVTTSFQLSAAPSSQTVAAGSSTNYTVSVTTNSGFNGSVILGVGGLPVGASANFSLPTLTTTGNSTLTIQTTTNTPGGSYALTIGGTNNGSVLTANVTLTVIGLVANPGTLLWSGASGVDTNWSTARNWTNVTGGGYGPPGISNNVVFTNTGAVAIPGTVNNAVDASVSVLSLQYSQTNNYHTTQIASGQTLTIATNLTAGTGTDLGANGILSAAITGSGGLLSITNTNCVVIVRQGTGTGTGPWSQRATLDLSGLGTFNGNVNRLLVAGDSGSAAFDSREVGTLWLAATNNLAASGAAPAIDIADNSANGAGANADPTNLTSYLYLGLSNGIYADSIAVGRSKSAGVLAFNPAWTNSNPTFYLRGFSASRVGIFSVGDDSAVGNSNQRSAGTVDLTGGTLDALINLAYIGQSMNGTNTGTAASATGTLTFEDGTLDVNTLEIGYQTLAAGTGPGAVGTVNVNGDGLLQVNQSLELAHGTNSSPPVQGTLNLNGGTVKVTNLNGGGGISTININSGFLDMQFTNSAPGQIANVSMLNIGASGVDNPASLANAASITVSNPIVIANNGTFAGNTIITSPGLIVDGTISPGTDGIGWMINNGPVTLGAGGSDELTVQDALAGPTAGWGFFEVNGGINVQATGANPFTIQLQSEGLADNFNYTTNYDWAIAAASGGIANFNANDFMVDNSQFNNDLAGGYFYVRQNGSSLVLSFTNNHPPA